MLQVSFYDEVEDALLKFAVIIARTNGKWVLCKHKERETYEVPGGHREENETILETAKRELKEETGAVDFTITPVCVYSVKGKTKVNKNPEDVNFGMLYVAEIFSFEEIKSEIERILITDDLKVDWTYPLIQPKLLEEANRRGVICKESIAFWEQLSFGTHPCLEDISYDGWLLRFANGYTKRANSVSMLEKGAFSPEEKVAYCEKLYQKRKLPAIFKITPLSMNVDEVLGEMDYIIVDKTNVMTLDLKQVSKVADYKKQYQKKDNSATVSIVIDRAITETWQEHYFTFNQISDKSIPSAKKIQEKIVNPVFCAAIYLDKEAAACGLGVLEQGCVGLLDIVVRKEYRGQGLGKLLCQSILAKAKEKGAETGYLQVVDANEVAKKLYESLGFVPRYSYWYRVKG